MVVVLVAVLASVVAEAAVGVEDVPVGGSVGRAGVSVCKVSSASASFPGESSTKYKYIILPLNISYMRSICACLLIIILAAFCGRRASNQQSLLRTQAR